MLELRYHRPGDHQRRCFCGRASRCHVRLSDGTCSNVCDHHSKGHVDDGPVVIPNASGYAPTGAVSALLARRRLR